MDNIKTENRTISELFSTPKSRFLVPDYQRPYSWMLENCEGLWIDLEEFALKTPNFDPEMNDYFLGTMVTFYNKNRQDEIIDGQQRITTLLLLLRAYYDSFGEQNDPPIKQNIGKCIWLTDERGNIDKTTLKLTSDVLQEGANEELAAIMLTGETNKKSQSNYAVNYRFFKSKIETLNMATREIFAARILNNCFVIKIRADTQEFALQIFSTTNDKGCPLSDTDLFKAALYKNALINGGTVAKDEFLERWALLEKRSNSLFTFKSSKVNAFEFAFVAYSYKSDNMNSRKGLRNYFAPNNYALLKNSRTLDEIFAMLDFLQDLKVQNHLRFSDDVLRRAYVFLRTGATFCYHILTAYFLAHHDDDYMVDNKHFAYYLDIVTAFVLGAVLQGNTRSVNFTSYGFAPIKSLIKNPTKILAAHKAPKMIIENNFRNYSSIYGKKIATPFILNWWTFKDNNQELIDLDIQLNIEHIFAKKRADFETVTDRRKIEFLGNFSLLEKSINSRASDFRFADKKKIYLGFTDTKGVFKKGTVNRELQQLATNKNDFTESDIMERNEQILSEILSMLEKHNLLSF